MDRIIYAFITVAGTQGKSTLGKYLTAGSHKRAPGNQRARSYPDLQLRVQAADQQSRRKPVPNRRPKY
jgi:hypothetical protein